MRCVCSEAETEETTPLLEATAISSSEPEKVPTPSAEDSTLPIPSASAPVDATDLHASLPSPVPTTKGLSTAEDKAVGQQGGAAVTPERTNEDKRVNNDKPAAVRLGAAAGDKVRLYLSVSPLLELLLNLMCLLPHPILKDLQDLLGQSSGSSTGGEKAPVVARGGAAGQASSVFNPVMTKVRWPLGSVKGPRDGDLMSGEDCDNNGLCEGC